ncbi:hypothetical protein RDI58_001000 [Solanum bulbocastanum]|uniref:Homeobox domain-containing protein n=1 Tax=Solanum bulbocastanum TaxID=147425 RepID=A0AAN8UBY4_SOLBU
MKQLEFEKSLSSLTPLGDANVFYWFQNRRSRSRRRHRQIQATLSSGGGEEQSATFCSGGAIHFDTSTANFRPMSAPSNFGSSSSSIGGVVRNSNDGSDGLLPFSENPAKLFCHFNFVLTNRQCKLALPNRVSGFMTVFINGVATEVPRGPLDMKAMFGREDLVLYHSSVLPLPVNEYGFILQSLQHGQSYFLLSHY